MADKRGRNQSLGCDTSDCYIVFKDETPYDLAALEYSYDDTQRKQGKKEVMDFLKIVMSTEKKNVSSKTPQQKGRLPIPTGLKEEIQFFSDKEFKGLLMSGAYRCYWNRIFFTGPFGVGKTSLAKMLVGDEAPEERESTDGIWIYLGRAGMDIQERCWIFLKHGTILNATVQSLLRSKEVKATVGAVKSVDEKEDTGKQSEDKKNQDHVTPIPDVGAVKHSGNLSKPGALKSQDNIQQAVKKKSKFQAFLDLPNRIQKAFKGKTPSHIKTAEDRNAKMDETKRDEYLTTIDMSEEEIIKLVRSQCTLGQYEMGDVEEQRTSLENSIEELFQNHGGKKHLQYKPLIFVNARNKEDEEIATLKNMLVDVALDHPRCGELNANQVCTPGTSTSKKSREKQENTNNG
ncbi:Hypothetical predicted protein [Mytilus galloprovincialis]|uniref:Uncharacterized protein n=1 Tax=Mytilus galloprovincialis TaxID=29158 RepID=A0A8B6F9P2_MYTGA|nr:Hypothetical predicted protein [Mytilus galloprovincialis]